MRKIDLNSVKDCGVIFSHGDFVILSGKNPWLFRKDGSFVAKYKQIRNAYDMIFLPGNIVVMDGLVDQSYHFIFLDTGELLWSCAQKGKRDFFPRKFAVSDNGKFVYYVYSIKGILHVDRLNLSEKSCTTYAIPSVKGAIYHCYCDANGYLCMLMKLFHSEGIMQWHPDDPIPSWKYHWTVPTGEGGYILCICNDEYVLRNDLKVRVLKTGEIFDLLENQKNMPPVFAGCMVQAYDDKRNLLTVGFTTSSSNIVVDCTQRKIVAHYVPVSPGLVGGCLIDDVFWMGSDDGIVKRPFPHMDPLPRKL